MCLLPLAIKHTSQVDMSASRDFSTWINLEMGRWQAIYILDGNEGSLSFEFGAFANSSLGKAESMSSRKNLKRFGMMSFQDIQWKLESESHHLMPFLSLKLVICYFRTCEISSFVFHRSFVFHKHPQVFGESWSKIQLDQQLENHLDEGHHHIHLYLTGFLRTAGLEPWGARWRMYTSRWHERRTKNKKSPKL